MKRNRKAKRPQTAILVTEYPALESFVQAFARGHINLLIIVGSHGLSKSRTIRRALGDDVCWLEGNASPFQIYAELYRHRDLPVVINDVDSLHSEKSGIRLLKSLCDTEEIKHVAWHTAAKSLKQEGIPRHFTTSSQVVIISNDWRTLNKNVAAVEDRGHVLKFQPSALAVHEEVASWFADREIHEWIGNRLSCIEQPSMRLYLRALELKRAGIEWRQVIPEAPEDKRQKLTIELLKDNSYATQEDRALAFSELGGGCRATFFNHLRRIRGRAVER